MLAEAGLFTLVRLLVILAIVAYLWAFPPFDTTLFASDSTVYTTLGIHIARHGSLVIDDPTVALLSPSARARGILDLGPILERAQHGLALPRISRGARLSGRVVRDLIPSVRGITRTSPHSSRAPAGRLGSEARRRRRGSACRWRCRTDGCLFMRALVV